MLTYDARQRLTSSTIATETTTLDYWVTGLVKKVTFPDGSFLAYDYDDAHRLIEVTDAAGNRISYTLDAAGNRLTDTVYDSVGVVTFSRTRVFEAFGRLMEEIGSQGQTTSYTYDYDGNVTSQMDPMGRETLYDYDELDRPIGITDPVLQLTEFGYDAIDNLVAVTDPKALTTTFSYNGLGDMVQLSSPDTGLSAFVHDVAGNLDLATDARGKTADYSYDALGRVVEIDYGDQTLQFGYDQGTNGAGRLTGASDVDASLSWAYDALGRVASRAQTVDTVDLDVGYAYDGSGRLSALTTPSGQVIAYSYGNGQVTGITVNGTALLSQVSYEPFGPTRGWQWGNGSTTVRAYDTDGQLTTLTSAGSTTYSYFTDGLIKSRTDGVEVSPSLAEGSMLFTIASASNRVQSASGLETRSYSYDAAGNTLSDGVRTFTYNNSGRMVTATSGGVTTSYTYNGHGERVRKAGGGLTRYFAYDESGYLIGKYDGAGGLVQETVWFGDIPVATLRPDGSDGIEVYYVHTDHLNTPRRVTRPADNVIVWRWDSVPFGETFADEDPDQDAQTFVYNLRFPGQYRDQETGLHYNYFRTFDPSTGRYLESDPIGLGGGLNTYGYVGGNPMNAIDPYGLDCVAVGNSVTCTAPGGGPTVNFPRPKDWPDTINSDSSNYHSYNIPVPLNGADAACAKQGIVNNPTPGSPFPASPQGILNNATPTSVQNLFNTIDWISSFGNDPGGYNNSPVRSYTRDNGNIVVNATLPGHPLHPGYVVRTVNGSQVNNYGEGTARWQGPYSPLAGQIKGVWNDQTQSILGSCGCQ
jgi:RHS repeat-associated protein